LGRIPGYFGNLPIIPFKRGASLNVLKSDLISGKNKSLLIPFIASNNRIKNNIYPKNPHIF